MNHFPVLLLRNLHAPCASQARWRALCEAVAVLLSKKMTCARPRRNATPSKHFPHTSHCTLRTPHSALHNCTSSQLISSELFSSHFMSSHMSAKFCLAIFMSTTSQYWCLLQKLAKTTSQYWCLLQKLAKTTSQYYFVLQSLHKVFPSTTLYYKACTKHFPVLLCTTKLAQNTFQYYFVLQSLHRTHSSTMTDQQLEYKTLRFA